MPSRDESIKPVAALFATASKPFAWWNFAANGAPTKALGSISTFTGTSTPDHSTRAGWWTNDGSEYYTAPTYLEPALQAVFDLGENVVMAWAQVNLATGADTAQDYLIQVGTGAQNNWSWVVSRSSTAASGQICTHFVNVAFSGDAAPAAFSGGSNAYSVNTDSNILVIMDNRPGEKRLYQYADGIQFGTASFAGKGACNYASATTGRFRFGATAAGSATNILLGAMRRFGAVNFGQTMPGTMNQIVHSLHQSNGIPTLPLLRAIQ
jgi:hypothetical protein